MRLNAILGLRMKIMLLCLILIPVVWGNISCLGGQYAYDSTCTTTDGTSKTQIARRTLQCSGILNTCGTCPAGKYSRDGATIRTLCNAGTYS
jgi:hypothetical protein